MLGKFPPRKRAVFPRRITVRQYRKEFSFGAGKPDSVPPGLTGFGGHLSRRLGRPPTASECDIPEAIGRAVQPLILSCTGRGFSCRPPRGGARWALTPPFHPYLPIPGGACRRYILCDTVRRRGLNRDSCTCRSARAASCPAVSGLSSPNFYRARRYPRLGIKELGATTRPQR